MELCVVCQEREIQYAFPCGHLCVCAHCCRDTCPICRCEGVPSRIFLAGVQREENEEIAPSSTLQQRGQDVQEREQALRERREQVLRERERALREREQAFIEHARAQQAAQALPIVQEPHRGSSTRYNLFMKEQILALKAGNLGISHIQAFKQAAALWQQRAN